MLEYLRDILAIYGISRRKTSSWTRGERLEQRSSAISMEQNAFRHIRITVATARTNGQVE